MSSFREIEGHLGLHVKIFVKGLLDSLSFHRALPDLVNNSATSALIGKIFLANCVLILGSLALYNKGILPFLDVLGESAFNLKNKEHYDSLLWFGYRWLWLGPICALCYGCCLAWYSELGVSLKKKVAVRSQTPMSQLDESLHSIYALLVWIMAFIQLQILTNIIPQGIEMTIYVADKVFIVDGDMGFSSQIMIVVHDGVVYCLRSLLFSNTVLTWLLMTTLYAWYLFDPIWIAQGVNPGERFERLHRCLTYFLGFGLPYTILNRTASFFVGFSLFLMIFPLGIIVASVSDYGGPYKEYAVQPVTFLPVFRPAQTWTLRLLRPFSKKVPVIPKEADKTEEGAKVIKSRQEVKISRRSPSANKKNV